MPDIQLMSRARFTAIPYPSYAALRPLRASSHARTAVSAALARPGDTEWPGLPLEGFVACWRRTVKINIDLDCTPEEARLFFGLPDVKPIQQAVMARIERQMLDAADAMSPNSVMNMWLQFMPQNLDQIRDVFTRFFAQPFGPPPGGCNAARKWPGDAE